ncbi:MAG TPA: sigma-54 dependent transcriptional regulator [Acidobacteriota bacterium]|nr:sigma-54 dependent transcriptional regulator [Acidobacteriota bacterium]
MQKKLNLLIVDDDPVTADMILQALQKEGYGIRVVNSGASAMEAGRKEKFTLILTDLRMPDMDGLEVLNWFRREQPEAIVVLMTAFGSSSSAIDAIQQGAYDYISKPFKIEELRNVIRKAVSTRGVEMATFEETEVEEFETIVGRSKCMIEIYKMIGRVADSEAPVLILGETGSGKELIARALHERSSRGKQPFLAVNCSAFTETLLESELFGHEKGAFTGALTTRPGIFEAADRGSCFLDEISETTLAMQSRLLRVLQNHEIKRVGSNQIITVHARIIASSNKDLRILIEKGDFRQDLYYRLNAITIAVPPLRERREDLPDLVLYFLRKFSPPDRRINISQEAFQSLMNYDWPGNIRELEHVIQRAVTVTPLDTILPEHLNLGGSVPHPAASGMDFNEQVTLDELEKRYIRYIYQKTGKNKVRTAEVLGIDRKTLYSKLARYGIEHEE